MCSPDNWCSLFTCWFFLLVALMMALMVVSFALPLHPFKAFWVEQHGRCIAIYFKKVLNCYYN